MEFSRQEYWSGLPLPSPGDPPDPGIKPRSPTLQVDSLLSEPPGKPKDTGVGSLFQGNFPTQEVYYLCTFRICSQCRRPQFDPWVGKIPWRRGRLPTPVFLGFPGGSDSKESTCNMGDLGLIPGLRRSPGEGNGYPLRYSCLENPHGQRSMAGYNPWGRTVRHY